MAVLFGADILLNHPEGDAFRDRLSGKRVALLTHPAGVDASLRPVWSRIAEQSDLNLSALLGPQHGFAGEKQDNMIESADVYHPDLNIPIFSLYGETRRLKNEWLDHFDVLLVDLQDVGVRVYTFLTTVGYLLQDLADHREKELWILDRPNPAGRIIEGLTLESGQESFVGVAPIPMQHGLTLGEFARWFRTFQGLNTNLTVVPMSGWNPAEPWPADRVWLQPSPNMPGLYTVRAYPGTVMLEGATFSEGRGTTRPLSLIGHPDVDWKAVRRELETTAPHTLKGCALRDISFEPTFHKHSGKVCPGFEIVAEPPVFNPETFRPYRLIAHIFKAVRHLHPDIPLWSNPPYEYEYKRIPIDVVNGGSRLRRWVENPAAGPEDLENQLARDETQWQEIAATTFIY